MTRADAGWLTLYVVLVALIAGSVFAFRAWVFATYASQQATAEWGEWREDATELSKQVGPVKRKPPKTAEPPGLILMRDHFPAVLVGGTALSAVLLAAILLLLRGALKQSAFVDRSKEMKRPV